MDAPPRRLGHVKGLCSGMDCFLCCPGPSLRGLYDASMSGPGSFVLAMNTAYPDPVARPNAWIGMDPPVCFDRRVWAEPFLKVARGAFHALQVAGRPLADYPNTAFAMNRKGPVEDCVDSDAAPLLWNRNTFLSALHLAVYLGAGTIYLVGCDFGGPSDYQDDRKLSDGQRTNNRRLMNATVRLLPTLRRKAKERGVTLMSSTPNSPANEHLEFIEWPNAVQKARAPAPTSQPVRLHSSTAEFAKWRDPAGLEAEGVMTGICPGQEWLWQPWIEAFRATNGQYPVAVADFGMEASYKVHIEGMNYPVIDMADCPAEGWFRKPTAILRSPFRRTLWLDLDCMVQDDMRPLLDRAKGGRIVAPLDLYAKHQERGLNPDVTIYDTGAIAVEWGDDAISEWAALCLERPWPVRGDQEMFSMLVHNTNTPISEFPLDEFAAWFNPKHTARTRVIHWCGQRGKDALRKSVGLGCEHTPGYLEATGMPSSGPVLINFWHGIGDNIIVSPAVKAFSAKQGRQVDWAMARCHMATEMHERTPWIGRVCAAMTPWDYARPRKRRCAAGVRPNHNEVETWARGREYDRVIHLDLADSSMRPGMLSCVPPGGVRHKLLAAADALGVELSGDSFRTEFHYDPARALAVLQGIGIKPPERYVFFHGKASSPVRSLDGQARDRLCGRLAPNLPVVCPDDILEADRVPLAVSAWLIEHAEKVIVTDSCMYHLAHALGKPVDFAFFAEELIRNMVRPLFAVAERVVIGREALRNYCCCGKPDPMEAVECDTICEVLGGGVKAQEPPVAVDRTRATTPVPDRRFLLALARAMGVRRVLELGVGQGATARFLLEHCPKIQRYVGVDVPPGFATRLPQQAELVPERVGSMVPDQRFEAIVAPEGSGRLPADRFGDKFDMVFIDGDHSSEGVEADTRLAFSVSHRSTAIVWHDYKPAPAEGVYEFLNGLTRDSGTRCVHVRGTWCAFRFGRQESSRG